MLMPNAEQARLRQDGALIARRVTLASVTAYWPALVIAVGVTATFAWTALLVWLSLRLVGAE
jgi:hypothetical protein